MPDDKALVYNSRIAVPYTWSAGLVGTRFFKAIKERRVFLATKCPSCEKTHLPPVKTCGECFKECKETVEVGPAGVLKSFTTALYKTPAQPGKRPVYGLIKLDGADTAFLHLLGGDIESLKIGMKVEPVFRDDGTHEHWGIRYFKLAGGD